MVVLALDTTTRQGSAAVTRDTTLVGTFAGDAAVTHGRRLPGDLVRLLDTHGLQISDVDLFAVAAGPGSFTGLRIGIATQQGLALANNRPLIGVSALDAIDHAVRLNSPSTSPEELYVWMDAQRGQVFTARYSGEGITADGAAVAKPGDALALMARVGEDLPRSPVFAGDGALTYAAAIRDVFPHARIVDHVPPLAPSIACLAETRLRQDGPMTPDAIRPIYVRPSDAELSRDRAK